MRVGLFGGTFNPIHNGHLASANEVAERFGLDRVIFIPNGRPPHKKKGEVLGAGHRFNMVTIATNSNPRFEASPFEIRKKGYSYSIDTVRAFRKRYGEDLFFITGYEAFEEIGSWKSADRLLRECHFIVTAGPGYSPEKLLLALDRNVTSAYPRVRFRRVSGGDRREHCHTLRVSGSTRRIFLAEVDWLSISSTLVRQRLIEGRSVRYLVDEGVERYLEKWRLFKGGK